MLLRNIRLLFRFYFKPQLAINDSLDEGSWVFGAVLVAIISPLFQFAVVSQMDVIYRQLMEAEKNYTQATGEKAPRNPMLELIREGQTEEGQDETAIIERQKSRMLRFSPVQAIVSVGGLALLYIPALVLIIVLLESAGSFGVAIRQNYVPLLKATLLSWSAAHIPFLIVSLAIIPLNPGVAVPLLWLVAELYFSALMILVLRMVFGAGTGKAIVAVIVAWISLLLQGFLLLLLSPFMLFMAYYLFRGSLADMAGAQAGRVNFRRSLEAATINPRDYEAHYQLGLIYQQRRQYSQAIERFRRSIEINPDETDAHYQLGRIAREQGRLPEAIDHFNEVVTRDDAHSHSEVWREIGGTYLAASMLDEAREALEKFVSRREHDPEGLYLLGSTLRKQGSNGQAARMFERCIEAINTMPYFRRGMVGKWGKFAEKELRQMRGSEAV